MQSILLIGVSHLGQLIAKEMQEIGHEVMAVDHDEDRINTVEPIVTDARIGDSTNVDFLRSLGVNNYDICFVTIASGFESSLVTTALLKEIGAKKIIARAESEIQERLLFRIGADEVINPEKMAAEAIASRFADKK